MGAVTSHRSGGRRRWLAVATAIAMFVAACGDDDSTDTDDVETDVSGAATDTTPDAGTAATTESGDTGTTEADDTGTTEGDTPAGDARELIIARDMDLTT